MNAYRFGAFVIDSDTRQLTRDGEPQHLSPKAFQLLEMLIERAPAAVSKSELQERLWPDTFVVEANLQHLVGEVRTALRDDPKSPRFVRTVYGHGYAFTERATATAAPTERARVVGLVCRLRWAAGRATLTEASMSSAAIPLQTS